MPVVEPAIRPPSEWDSFLLQVTCGCSANSCSFCGAYLNKQFRIKDINEIFADIDYHAKYYPDSRRVFLMDGDALVLSNKQLIPILKYLQEKFPKLRRISSYANGYNIVNRSKDELEELYDNKLTLIYMGLESGSQKVLDFCDKKSSVTEMVKAVKMATEVGIKSSVIVLLGLGSKECSQEHVSETIKALNKMQPRYLSYLSLMLVPGTKLHQQMLEGKFIELSPEELIKEAHQIIEGLDLKKTIFRSNHASNHIPLEGTLPKDKTKLLNALNPKKTLKPEYLRGL